MLDKLKLLLGLLSAVHAAVMTAEVYGRSQQQQRSQKCTARAAHRPLEGHACHGRSPRASPPRSRGSQLPCPCAEGSPRLGPTPQRSSPVRYLAGLGRLAGLPHEALELARLPRRPRGAAAHLLRCCSGALPVRTGPALRRRALPKTLWARRLLKNRWSRWAGALGSAPSDRGWQQVAGAFWAAPADSRRSVRLF